jgi:zinc/manganese transport system substrate-binding protein
MGELPADRRRVVTGHDAFGYLADAYGLRFYSPRGWSTDSEPSAAAVARLVRQVRELQASALLVENLSDPRLIERIARESGARVGGRLYADALSPPGGEADTYLKLFAHNVDTLLAALAPATALPTVAKP